MNTIHGYNPAALAAGAIALLIVWFLARIGWRIALHAAEPMEDWFEDSFESAPVAAKAVMIAVALAIFIALMALGIFLIWRNTGVLLALGVRLVDQLNKIKL